MRVFPFIIFNRTKESRIGFVVNGTDTYYYRFNLQGDVTGIYDAAGNLVAEYAYDAWGKLIDSDNTEIGNLNPIRYRGYYYDDETGFYYLQTRYYDPETGRFINADVYASTGQGVLGHNMFAYCLNNPVNFADPTGCACICLTRRVGPRHVCESVKEAQKEKELSFEEMLSHMARPREEGLTFSVGFTGEGAFGGTTSGASGVLSVDTSYNYAFQETTSLGASSGMGLSGGIVFTYTNATDVQDLTGLSYSYGITLVSCLGMSIDYVEFNPDSNPNKTCRGISIVIAFGAEADIHSAENYTESTRSWNPFLEVKKKIFGK